MGSIGIVSSSAPASSTTDIVILGGNGAVSADVESTLKSRYPGSDISRIAGSNRYETAGLISRSHFEPEPVTAYVAIGSDFPDALASTPAATGPLMLTSDHAVPSATASAIAHLTGLPCTEFEESLGTILAIGDSVMAGASKRYAPVPNLESGSPA